MKGVSWEEMVEEVKKQVWLAGPLFTVGVLQFSLQIISVMFVGHLGELPLSSASLATSFASVTGFNLLMGMASALDTLCGQSFGAGQHHMLGIHMQRATIILSIVSVFLAIILKAWTFELMVLLSGLLPNPQLETSVLSICLNTFVIAWMIPFGLSCAASTRISNELGAGCPKAAYLAVKVTLLMSFMVGALGFTLLMFTRNIWGHIFTNVPEVVRYVASMTMTPILASSVFVDSFQTALSGIELSATKSCMIPASLMRGMNLKQVIPGVQV